MKAWSSSKTAGRRSVVTIGSDNDSDDESETELEKMLDRKEMEVIKAPSETMVRARQMFMLDQLRKPTPSTARSGASSDLTRQESVMSNRSDASRFTIAEKTEHQINLKQEQLKKEKSKKQDAWRRRSVGRLNPTNKETVSSALGESFLMRIREMGLNTYWPMSGLIREKEINENIGLNLGIRLVRDVSRIIEEMHAKNEVHGALNADKVLLDRNLKIHVEAPGGVREMSFKTAELRQEFAENRKAADMLALGILILELVTGREINQQYCPQLYGVREHFLTMIKQPQKKLDDLSVLLVEEINGAFDGISGPAAVKEFCVRTVSRNDKSRMTAEEAQAWLDGLVDRIEVVPPKDSIPHLLKILLSHDDIPLKKARALVNVKGGKKQKQMKSRAKAKQAAEKEGYKSDGSFYVSDDESSRKTTSEVKKPKKKPRNKQNRLSMFLQQSAEQKAMIEEAQSLIAEEKAKQERKRRRSTDRDFKKFMGKIQQELNLDEVLKDIKWGGNDKKTVDKIKKMHMLDPEDIAKRFERQERLPLEMANAIIQKADASLREEPNNIQLRGGVIIVGDIHGQFFDLRNMFSITGVPGTLNDDGTELTFVFLGDYVDRGKFSCEVMLYLFALKVRYPGHVWLLRGNHESKATSGYFGFKQEVQQKYGLSMFSKFCDAFQAMPLAATITTEAGRFFCVHGGISPNVTHLHQFVEFDRFSDPDIKGFLCDVLWADPVELKDEDEEENYKQALGNYFSNPLRGCSYRFGLAAIQKFLQENDLVALIRAHQVQASGYQYHYFKDLYAGKLSKDGEMSELENTVPPVITVFSAPNYCGTYGNKGAILTVLDSSTGELTNAFDLLQPTQFEAVIEPEEVVLKSEERIRVDQIETNTPYMPTSFDDFVAKATELKEGDHLELLELHKKNAPSQETKQRKKFSQMSKERKKSKQSKNVKEVQQLRQDSAVERFKRDNFHSQPSYRQIKGLGDDLDSFKSIAQRINIFEAAAKSDRLSEINPLIKEKKLQEAKEKVKVIKLDQLPSNISIEEDKKKRASMRIIKMHKQNKDGKVSFTKSELESLQALFLIIDREGRGMISVEDLMAWSEDEESISAAEAEQCLETLDFDDDGFIGFQDYMIFAAYAKKVWLNEMMQQKFDMLKQKHRK